MTFTSARFALFLLAAVVIYGLAPKKWRWAVLLTASCVFYGLWNWQYLWVLALVTLASYWAARKAALAEENTRRGLWLGAGLAVVLGTLFAFKYYDYVVGLVSGVLAPGRESPPIA